MSEYHNALELLQVHCKRTEAALFELGVNARVNVEEDFLFCQCEQERNDLLKRGVEIPVLVDTIPEGEVEMLGVTVVVIPCARFSIPLWKSGDAIDAAFEERLNAAFSKILLAAATVQQAASDIELERLRKN